MPAHLVKDLAAEEIANTCGVSIDAAKYQYNVIHKGGCVSVKKETIKKRNALAIERNN